MNKDLFNVVRDRNTDLLQWIEETLERHATGRKPVSGFGFPRLSRFFSEELLGKTYAVIVKAGVPVPPLLVDMAGMLNFSTQGVIGITYRDTYFLNRRHARDESLHFHEIIHTIQWSALGAERFVSHYALQLLENGYSRSFLERQAYHHAGRFKAGEAPYDAEGEVAREIGEYLGKAGKEIPPG